MTKQYFDYSKRKEVLIDYDNVKSILSAERQKAQLENLGYYLYETKQMGLSKFKLVFMK